jgi:hypothetical protein
MSTDGVIYFEGGPNDGQAYKTADLLGHQALTIPIVDYVWTSETKTSEKTGTVAQIWRYKGLTEHQNDPVSAAPAPLPAPVATPVSTVTEEPVVVTEPVEAVATTSHVDAPAADAVLGDAGVVVPEPVAEPVSAGSVVTSVESMAGLPTGEELQQRRKALKVSVGVVGDKAGLAHSKVSSIEKGRRPRLPGRPWRVRSNAGGNRQGHRNRTALQVCAVRAR